MGRILLTGGAGFIGSALVRHLVDRTDDEITILDALTYAGNPANLDGIVDDRRVRFVHGDITDRETVRTVIAGHDRVLHLAAESHVDRSLLDPDVFVRTNCEGTNVLCDEAVRAGVGRFLHVSTDEVYGSIEGDPVDETAPLRPTSPYSASKAGSDLIALSHHHSRGLPVVIARSSNQHGPRQFPEKLIPLAVTTLLDGGDVPVYGDGLNVRDWLHVEDNCAALTAVLDRGEPGTVYNIAGHNERTNLEVIDAILATLDLDRSRIRFVSDRPGHDRRYAITSTRLAALGVPAGRRFDEALEATVGWYVDHRAWWEPLLGRVRNR